MLTALELVLILLWTFLLWVLGGKASPFSVLPRTLARLYRERAYRWPLFLSLALLALNTLETRFDGALTAALGYEATPWIHALEGDWARGLQQWSWLPATYLLTFIYVVLFPALIAAPMFLVVAEGNLAGFRALSTGLVLNYVICLPFYLLFPVREMWSGNPENVRLLMDQVSPAVMEAYRVSSALDNCFPSFHTSLALTIAMLMSRIGPRRLAAACWLMALAVVFSTLYLGIHWLSDAAAGTLLALFASGVAGRGLRVQPGRARRAGRPEVPALPAAH